MYLVDTNIFLEALLEQEKTEEVPSFFQSISIEEIFITDISLHSIGIILFRLKKIDLFDLFIEDMIINGANILSLKSEELKELKNVVRNFSLDFEDAYQYLIAEKYSLQLISFDKDFDNTKKGRKEPFEILQ